jgi:quinol-cytochrome oxidoreductase complex cytochrome b subunit
MYLFYLVFTVYIFQVSVLLILCSHPDNSIEVNELVTPIHIVPEWYLLAYYVVLKGIPNINTGFL